MEKKAKKVFVIMISVLLLIILPVGIITAVIDPYFHFHKPIEGLNYPLNNERYQNYGIARNYDYDAVIVGTSMSEYFKPSEFDELFGVKSVKLPLSGGSQLEINEELNFVFSHHSNVRYVIRGIDLFRAFDSKDSRDYPAEDYPTYLYDDNPINDIRYVLNKDVFFKATASVVYRSLTGEPGDTLDSYMNWSDSYTYGPDGLNETYNRVAKETEFDTEITAEEYERIHDNIYENVIKIAEENPSTEFYMYISPYSILFFDYVDRSGGLDRIQKAERYILSLLTGYDNIHVFSFYTDTDMICDLYNYRDMSHHSEAVNTQILKWLKEGHGELTADDYNDYCDMVWYFYHSYDYDRLFEDDGVTLRK